MLQNFINLPLRLKISLIILIATILTFLTTSLSVYRLQAKKRFLAKTQKALLLESSTKLNNSRNFSHCKTNLEKLVKSYAVHGHAFQKPYRTIFLIEGLTDAAFQSNVALQKMQQKETQNTQDFLIHHWHLSVNGEYRNLSVFLNTILNPTFAYFGITDAFALKRETKISEFQSKKLQLEISLAFYQEKKALSLKDIANFVDNIPHPFVLSKEVFTRDPFFPGLNYWPKEKLKILGELRFNKEIFGIIKTPDGKIHKVKENAKIALKKKSPWNKKI